MADPQPMAGGGPSGRATWPDELFDYGTITPERVTELTDAALVHAEALIADACAAATSPGPSFTDVLGRIDQAEGDLWDSSGEGAFLVHVHPDPAVRDAAQRADERLTAWRNDLLLRDDVNAAITAYAITDDAAGLVGERRRLLDRWLRDLRRAGHGLTPERRTEVRAITTRIVTLESEFGRVLAEWSDGLDLTDDDLVGLPKSYVERLGPGVALGTRRVTLEYPDYLPFMAASPRRDLRRELARRFASRGVPRNREILEELVALRRQKASLLGYPSWAHYRIEPKMAATPERVATFHDEILPALRRLAAGEYEAMRDRLRADGEDGDLQPWDVAYYHHRILAEEHGVDHLEIAAHLPLESVLSGLLELCETVFGLRFAEIDDAHAWHDEVRLFAVRDAATDEILGWFYADLHPRDGKFGHDMAWPLRLSRAGARGTRRGGISAIVSSQPRPTADTPALLRHSDVETLFHEFGHVLHEVLGRNETHRLSMWGLEEDFPEAISQIMENWAWEPDILARISRHHETGAPLPPTVIERLVGSRTVDLGSEFLRVFGTYGVFDLLIHATEPIDLEEARREADAVRGLPSVQGTFWPASFGHLAAGYDAGYYGYLWSRVYGDDLWSRFEAEGVASPEVGAAYRRDVLEPGATADAEVLVERFLGRPATNRSFLRLTGIDPGTDAA